MCFCGCFCSRVFFFFFFFFYGCLLGVVSKEKQMVGEFTTHFRTWFSGWIGMFTGGTIWILTHGKVHAVDEVAKSI